MKNQMLTTGILAMTLALVATITLPTTLAAQPTTRVRIVELDPPATSNVAADGLVKLAKPSTTTELFRLRVFADLPDGSIVMVKVRRNDRPTTSPWATIGAIEIQLGSGMLSLSDVHEIATAGASAFPLAGLEEVRVMSDSTVQSVILAGYF